MSFPRSKLQENLKKVIHLTFNVFSSFILLPHGNRDFKIGWLRRVVELFCVVATTEDILLTFCRLRNSRILSVRKKVFSSPALSEREANYVSCV